MDYCIIIWRFPSVFAVECCKVTEKLCEDFGGDIKACSRSGISVNKDTLRI